VGGRTGRGAPRLVLRLVRFSSGGDPLWVHDLGDDGIVHIALSDAHAWIGVIRRGADGPETEIFDVDPSGRRRWHETFGGWQVLDLSIEDAGGQLVRLDAAGVPWIERLDEAGANVGSSRLRDANPASVSIGRDRVVVASTTVDERGSYGSTNVTAYDGAGARVWSRGVDTIGACGAPRIRGDDEGRVVVVQPLCGREGMPGGLVVDRLDAEGTHLWRERLGEPESRWRGAHPVDVTVDGSGHVVVVGRTDFASPLVDDGLFVVRMRP
jgi:hypothetical protein